MASCDSKLSLKLLIDTKAKKVLFGEAEKDCVDFLLHILSLPVSTVIRLLKNEGMNGCLANLYHSVENMNDTYIQSNQGKDILLKPKSPLGIFSVPLLSLNDVPTQSSSYVCNHCYNPDYVTDDPSAPCPICRRGMSRKLTYVAPPVADGAVASKGGFVKEAVRYMVMDDLVVKPVSIVSSITGLNKFNVKDVGVLQEKVVNIGMKEALKLLKASFESKTVLTSVFVGSAKRKRAM